MRACPFCGSTHALPYGQRREAVFVRCRDCRAIFRDLSPDGFNDLHDTSFADERFITSILSSLGHEPDWAKWNQYRALLPDTILEIGPGSGHFLAAAHRSGRTVAGVETSATHRDFIRSEWGVDSLYSDIVGVPQDKKFASIVAFNVLEHVYDVRGFLLSLAAHLETDGRIFVSTVNAAAGIAKVAGTWWWVFKEPDHVSFPTRRSLEAAGHRSGLRLDRVWTGELPFETVVSAVVAIRDWRRETTAEPKDEQSRGTATATTSMVNRLYANPLARLDPSSRLAGVMGAAGTVKALFVLE
jgi:SAM-dependent methyltransferase